MILKRGKTEKDCCLSLLQSQGEIIILVLCLHVKKKKFYTTQVYLINRAVILFQY